MNPQMFNSFLDGTKSAIEMAAIANATGLEVPTGGLLFPPCGVDDLPHVMRPRDKGGVLEKSGVVEVVSSLERDGRPASRKVFAATSQPWPNAICAPAKCSTAKAATRCGEN
jgi:predicted homoserine dehydrogenase-like protein